MTKLFEYREYKKTEVPVPFCWKVLATLFTASVFLAMTVVCGSCRQDDIEANVVEEGQPATLRLEVTGEEEMDISTRTLSEDVINNLHVLVYNSQGELIGQKYQIGSSTIIVNTVSATDCTIYAIANTGKADLFKGYDIHQESSLQSKMYSIANWDDLTTGTVLPMTGQLKNVDITPGEQTVSTVLTLTRMVAKIKLNIDVKPNSGITIDNCKIYNLPESSYYISGASDAAASVRLISESIDLGSTTTAGTTFYMFENRRGVKSGIAQQKDKNSANAPANATYVEISGSQGGVVTAKWIVYLGENATTDFNIRRNGNYEYNITLNDAAVTDTRVTLTFGGVEDLSASGTSNCYLASKTNTWYKFKATVRGNGAATGAVISPTGAALAENAPISPTDVELVWETNGHRQVIQGITLKDGYVYFKTGAATDGNAVVAVKDADDNILWSWHIWKTSFDVSNMPTQKYKTKPKSVSGYNTIFTRYLTMMDRNLGAYSNKASQTDDVIRTYGLLYLWGRKDPFPCAATREAIYVPGTSVMTTVYDKNGKVIDLRDATHQVTSETIGDGTNNIFPFIDYSIKNPATYVTTTYNDYPPDKSSYSWIYGTYANLSVKTAGWRASTQLWGSGIKDENNTSFFNSPDTRKTIYDPCPVGWCLPPADVFSNFTIDSYSTIDPNQYNCVEKENFNVEGSYYLSASVFGRKFYINEESNELAFFPAQGFRERENGTICCIGHFGVALTSFPYRIENAVGSTSNVFLFHTNTVGMGSGFHADAFPVRCVKQTDLNL